MFDDLVAANERYASRFPLAHLRPGTARRLAVVTCIDARIDPLAALGLAPGDAKIVRNAGARVTDDALRSLAVAVHVAGVDRVAVVHHTDCAMAAPEHELRAAMGAAAEGWDLHAISDPDDALRRDVAAIRSCPLVPRTVAVAGFRYDVATGRLHALIDA